MLYGLIAGCIYRARALCTHRTNADEHIRSTYRFLLKSGYTDSKLRPLFSKAMTNIMPSPTDPPEQQPLNPLWIFKTRYHPQDPPSSEIRHAWQQTVENPPLSKRLDKVDIHYRTMPKRQFLVCYKKHPNIGQLLSYQRIKPDSGPPVSSFL